MTTTARYVLYERDEEGVPFAIEVVEAPAWDPAVLVPPPPAEADARLVRLGSGLPPAELPRWLHVEVPGRRVAETSATYLGAPAVDAARRIADIGRALWPWSPYYRSPGSTVDEFLRAGAVALSHPQPAPAEGARRLELITAFCAERLAPLGDVATLRADALERWLAQAFGDPDTFADTLLVERIGDTDPAAAEELRFVRDAEVPADAHDHIELAIDRRVLIAQASPWRYVEGVSFVAPLAALRAWRRRYERVYEAHYRLAVSRSSAVRQALDAARGAVEALERLDGIRRLGPPLGQSALALYRTADRALRELPPEPERGLARTAGVTLGRELALLEQSAHAIGAVRQALEAQRTRLASAAVRLILDRPGVPALDRLLQAIGASDLDGIERVLDDALAAHIDQLLAEAARSPLVALAQQYPQVTPANLEEALATLRALLDAAIAGAPDGAASLR